MLHQASYVLTELCACVYLIGSVMLNDGLCCSKSWTRFDFLPDYPAVFCPHTVPMKWSNWNKSRGRGVWQSQTHAVYSRCEWAQPLLPLHISASPQGFLCVSSPWPLTWPIGKLSFRTAPIFSTYSFFSPLKFQALLSTLSLCSPTSPNIPTLGVNQGMWRSKCPLLLAEWTFCPHPLNVLTKGHPVSPLLSPSRGMRGVITQGQLSLAMTPPPPQPHSQSVWGISWFNNFLNTWPPCLFIPPIAGTLILTPSGRTKLARPCLH